MSSYKDVGRDTREDSPPAKIRSYNKVTRSCYIGFLYPVQQSEKESRN